MDSYAKEKLDGVAFIILMIIVSFLMGMAYGGSKQRDYYREHPPVSKVPVSTALPDLHRCTWAGYRWTDDSTTFNVTCYKYSLNELNKLINIKTGQID